MAGVPKDIKERVKKLRDTINRHRKLYHTHDKPEISDEAYDALIRELQDLENKFPKIASGDSPTQLVGDVPLKEFKKISHQIPQWSFDNAFDEDDIRAFDERVTRLLGRKPEYLAELKIDGLKIVLTYEKGVLKTATTRGDGRVGEDVTNNILTIKSIPQKLNKPVSIIVEGEIWMSKRHFDKLNKDRRARGEDLFANPRNVAAGSVRQLDPAITRARKLDSFIYDIASLSGLSLPKDQEGELKLLKELGFKVNPNFKKFNDILGLI
ncbi:MAG: DNA ligase (NAD(+)) LigA, partial [Candidatus Zambryskibacteria bacterium CG_4_9_14_3_um_filter_42_15]